MYQLTCDGFPLLDWRDNDLILANPKVKLEVNTVGEGSFTIYKNHPYYDKLKKLKSVFEVSDETEVIFRGRATGDTVDFDHGMAVDLEGAMAYFNDSVVRPFNFPNDFLEDEDYIAAAESGNVVEFFLSWLISNHNLKVQEFQRLKLGNVTVRDPNNYITRSNSKYASTWETVKSKLFDSELGGYLCIRYKEDGNYIDYLSEFTETNSQQIVLGENLIDLKNDTEASQTYSAIIPIGAADLTIEGQENGNLTDDLVKSGDTIYSRKAVESYGWIYAPTSETTWDDVTDDANLLRKAAEWLANEGILQLSSIEATAVDLHFTDEQIESLRIYKNVDVYSEPHGVTETFPLKKLEIDLLNSQNTKINVGKTLSTLTERTSIQQEEAKAKYSKLSKTDDEILLEVKNTAEKLESSISQTVGAITLTVQNNKDGTSSYFELKSGKTVLSSGNITFNGYVTFTGLSEGTTTIDGGCIQTGTILATLIKAGILQSKDGETFKLDLDNGTFSMKGSGQFQSHDGNTYIEIDGNELVLYAFEDATKQFVDKIRLGFITGDDPNNEGVAIDYPYMLLGNSGGTVGMIKEFYNGLWIGNSVPKYSSGNFEGMADASGFFINTRTGNSYVVNGTTMQNVYTGAAIAKFA